jgi:hypothetical protein
MILIITFVVGVVMGIYLSSQLEKNINTNIRREAVEKYDDPRKWKTITGALSPTTNKTIRK